jgi:hypothetical protein
MPWHQFRPNRTHMEDFRVDVDLGLTIAAALLSACLAIAVYLSHRHRYVTTKFGGARRSSQWPAFLKAFLKEHPACKGCRTSHKVTAHHIIPFYLRPDLELDKNNLVTVCRYCHFTFGHLNDWCSHNPTVLEDLSDHMARVLRRNVSCESNQSCGNNT